MLDWEESVFVGLKKLYQRVFTRPVEQQRLAIRATLAERRGRLHLLAQMLAEKPVTLFEVNDATLFFEDRIFLPAQFSEAATLEANADLYALKVVAAALAIRCGWRMNGVPLDEHIRRCDEEFPGIADLVARTQARFRRARTSGNSSAFYPQASDARTEPLTALRWSTRPPRIWLRARCREKDRRM